MNNHNPDPLAKRLAGLEDARMTLRNSNDLRECDTAREWLNSSHGRRAEFIARQVRASKNRKVAA